MAKKKKKKSQQHGSSAQARAQKQAEAPEQASAVEQIAPDKKSAKSAKSAPSAPSAQGSEFAPEIGDFSMREMSAQGHFTFYALLVLVFLVPLAMNFFFTNQGMVTYDAFDTVKVWILRIGSLVLLVSWLIDLLKNGGEIRYHKIYLLLAFLLIWMGISTVVSVSPLTAFFGKHKRYDGLWSYLIYAILFFVSIQYVTTYERIKLLARTLSLSSLFVGFYGLLQWLPSVLNPAFTFIGKHIFNLKSAVHLNLDLLPWGKLPFEQYRSFSTYGNPDLLAGFLAFGVFVTLGLVLSEERKSWRIFYWIVLIINGMVVITAKSRSIWVGGAVGLILAVILLVKQKPRWMKLDFGFAGGVGLGAILVALTSLGSKSVVMNFWNRVTSIFQFSSGSALTRFQIWGAAVRAIKQRPVFGWGSDTFRLVFRRFEPFAYNQSAGYQNVADNVHNFPLQLAAGIGIAGMLAFYAIMFWVIVPAVKLCVAPDEEHKGERMIFIGLLAAVVAYNVHLFFGISIPGASFLLWVVLGVLIVPRTKAVVIDPVPWAVPASAAAIVIALVPAAFSFRFLAADHHYYLATAYGSQVQGSNGQIDTNAQAAALAEAQAACKLNPTIEIYRAQEVSLLTQQTLTAVQQKAKNAGALTEQTEQSITAMLNLSPYEYDSYLYASFFWNGMGEQYQQLGNTKQANYYYDKAANRLSPQVKAMPNGLALRLQYAQALQGQGKFDEALRQLRYCMKGDPKFTEAKQAYDDLIKLQSQEASAAAATHAATPAAKK